MVELWWILEFCEKNDAVILDVGKNFPGGAIEGAININVDDFTEQILKIWYPEIKRIPFIAKLVCVVGANRDYEK